MVDTRLVTITDGNASMLTEFWDSNTEETSVSLPRRMTMKRLTISRYNKSRDIDQNYPVPPRLCDVTTTVIRLSLSISFVSVGWQSFFRPVFSYVLVINIKVPRAGHGIRIADSNTATVSSEGGREN